MSASTAQIIEAENARFSARMAFDLADIAARELVAGRQADFEDSRLRVLRFLESAHAAMTAAGPRCEGKPHLRLIQTPALRVVSASPSIAQEQTHASS